MLSCCCKWIEPFCIEDRSIRIINAFDKHSSCFFKVIRQLIADNSLVLWLSPCQGWIPLYTKYDWISENPASTQINARHTFYHYAICNCIHQQTFQSCISAERFQARLLQLWLVSEPCEIPMSIWVPLISSISYRQAANWL